MKPCTVTCHDLWICHSSCPCLFPCSEVALRTHCEDTMGLRPNDRTCGMLHNDYGSSPCPRICVRLLVCFFDLRCVIPRGPNNLWPIKASVSGQPATNQMAADCKMKCSAKSNALNTRKSHIPYFSFVDFASSELCNASCCICFASALIRSSLIFCFLGSSLNTCLRCCRCCLFFSLDLLFASVCTKLNKPSRKY